MVSIKTPTQMTWTGKNTEAIIRLGQRFSSESPWSHLDQLVLSGMPINDILIHFGLSSCSVLYLSRTRSSQVLPVYHTTLLYYTFHREYKTSFTVLMEYTELCIEKYWSASAWMPCTHIPSWLLSVTDQNEAHCFYWFNQVVCYKGAAGQFHCPEQVTPVQLLDFFYRCKNKAGLCLVYL